MAITARQTNLLVNQDWKKVYQTFKEADFQSYDFETLRKTMIDYLRTYYPEDFNDFTDSSEFIAQIDLIAFLGQALAFRGDLNARENFFDTAERRDSILKLARLISYNPKRNIPASGYLKVDSVSTTENIFDSNGLNLSNLIVGWNDGANADWLEQFITILNSALISNQVIGKPGNSTVVNGIQTDDYSVNLVQNIIPTYPFSTQIEGNNTNFEAVSGTAVGETYIYEGDPVPSGRFNILYRNDQLGNGSNNTGYFVYFKQGSLASIDFSLQQSLPNRIVNVNFNNINNTDLWLYELDSNGTPVTKWTQVPAVAGINVIYNQSVDRNLFQVNTRASDQIDLVFGDGSFSNIPQGNFRLYYRTSNGASYKITPDEMQSIGISLAYVSRTNQIETLTVRASLHYTVTNSSARETVEDIRTKAPQQYYTQNRMITGEDYNIFPYTNFNSILKTKAVNRSSSGVSRYLDVLDVTGKYSSTSVFATDGWLYKEEPTNSVMFTFTSPNDINDVIYNIIRPILTSVEVKQFYYENFTRYPATPGPLTPPAYWLPVTPGSGTSIGSFCSTSTGGTVFDIGPLTGSDRKYITQGAMIKLSPGAGNFFDTRNRIQPGTATYEGEHNFIYATIVATLGNNQVRINQNFPSGTTYPQVVQIIPVFKNDIPNKTFTDQIVRLIQSYKNFGLRYNVSTQSWEIIQAGDLNLTAPFNETKSTAGTGSDSSWLLAFTYNGISYNVSYRSTRYIIESLAETRFYFDPKIKVYDSKTGLTVKDQINILKINSQPDSQAPLNQDQLWYVYSNVTESDGYQNSTKLLITFTDTNNDGVPDDPDLFFNVVSNTINKKWVFFQQTTGNGFITYVPVDNTTIVTDYATKSAISISLHVDGQVFYATSENKFYKLTLSAADQLPEVTNYAARIGRQNLYFHHRHNSPNDRRIDPSPNNIMDLYIITKQYASDYLAWIVDSTKKVSEPILPTNEELKIAYGSGSTSLEKFKTLSDTIVYNSGKFKPLFGFSSAVNPNLQATFKIVKNPNVSISDNDIKTSVVSAINSFFDTANWDFGETFYFSELSTYLHNALVPNIASIIIVPSNTNIPFGSIMQVNSNPDEVIVSAATVDNIEIISAITASQINQSLAGLSS